ncbi:MAG TPA: hypothetical protein VGJ13_18790, partial [Pseudonocardiaceae bacterium]
MIEVLRLLDLLQPGAMPPLRRSDRGHCLVRDVQQFEDIIDIVAELADSARDLRRSHAAQPI